MKANYIIIAHIRNVKNAHYTFDTYFLETLEETTQIKQEIDKIDRYESIQVYRKFGLKRSK